MSQINSRNMYHVTLSYINDNFIERKKQQQQHKYNMSTTFVYSLYIKLQLSDRDTGVQNFTDSFPFISFVKLSSHCR